MVQVILPKQRIEDLVKVIKQKKELHQISSAFVQEQLIGFLHQNPQLEHFLEESGNPRSAQYKKIVKEVRAKLRRLYGLFRVEEEIKEVKELVSQLLNYNLKNKKEIKEVKEVISKILSTHSSTRERLPFYEEIYRRIFEITGKPQTILDLGCGVNPFSLLFMGLKKLNYLAFDLDEEEISSLNSFFHWQHQKNPSFIGKAEVFDLMHWIRLEHSFTHDLCFLFKMTDLLDKGKGHKVSEEVIKHVPSKFVVVSFPTLTMSGKKMTAPRRRWMEWLCKRLEYKYWILEFSNEIFYLVKK